MTRSIWLKICISLFGGMLMSMPATHVFAQNSATQSKASKAKSPATPKRADKKTHKKTSKTDQHAKSKDALKTSMDNMLDAYIKKQYKAALVYCEEGIQVMPNDIEEEIKISVYSMCMQLYDRNNRPKDALEVASKLKQFHLDTKERDSLCFQEATLLTKLHRWDEASSRYAECPGTTPAERAIVESNLAELEMIVERPDVAVEKYKASIAASNDNPHSLFGIAVALSRISKWDEAMAYFLDGVSLDPGFDFLNYAFFEPAAETDYQTAYRMLALHRSREARYYLDKYIKSEMRTTYRDQATRELTRLDNEIRQNDTAIRDTFPVLLDNIRTAAIDDTGTKLAFSVAERQGKMDIRTVVWTLDTESGETHRRIELGGDIVTDMMFVPNTQNLRILGGTQRYELDVADAQSGYYCYDNTKSSLATGLTGESDDIMAVTSEGWLTISPWMDVYLQIPIVRLPTETRQLLISADHRTVIIGTASNTQIMDITHQKTIKTFSDDFQISAIAAHPQKQRQLFALGMQTGTLLVDTKGKILAMLGSPNLSDVTAVAFSPNGKWLAAVSDFTVEIWDVEKGLRSH